MSASLAACNAVDVRQVRNVLHLEVCEPSFIAPEALQEGKHDKILVVDCLLRSKAGETMYIIFLSIFSVLVFRTVAYCIHLA